MKTTLYLIVLLMAGIYTSYAQSSSGTDTVIVNRLNKLVKVNTDGNRSLKALVVKSDSIKRAVVAHPPAPPCVECLVKPDFKQWILILLPVILFILLLWYFLSWLKKGNYKIADALSVDMSDEQVEKLQATSAEGETPPQPVLKRSSSRLIAFFSGLSAVIIAICITSYYMYFAIKGLPIPRFEDLWPILASLGIGVVPYATKVMNEKK